MKTKRAKDVEVGDLLADLGLVTYARVHAMDKAPVSYAGMPLYRWPNQELEVAA